MKNKNFYLGYALLSVFATNQIAFGALPDRYQYLDRTAKQEVLWRQIQALPYSGLPTQNPSGLEMLNIANVRYLLTSFTNKSDEMPEGRHKLLHTYGSTAKVEFRVTHPSMYTGLLKTGGIGLARLSLAKMGGSFTPGMALKLLVDGQESRNIHVMNALDGQGDDHNFFSHRFSNMIAPPKDRGLQLVAKIFHAVIEKLRNGPESETNLPLFGFAEVKPDGTFETFPEAPAQIFFNPTQTVQDLMAQHKDSDFRTGLAQIPAGTTLYTVTVTRSKGSEETEIGEVVTSSPFVASNYEDTKLFFQHADHRM